jgi:hypothetical protein
MQCEKVLREAVCGNVSRTDLAEIAGGDVVCSFLRAFTCDVMFSLHTETRSDDESKAIPILCTRYVVSKEVRWVTVLIALCVAIHREAIQTHQNSASRNVVSPLVSLQSLVTYAPQSPCPLQTPTLLLSTTPTPLPHLHLRLLPTPLPTLHNPQLRLPLLLQLIRKRKTTLTPHMLLTSDGIVK